MKVPNLVLQKAGIEWLRKYEFFDFEIFPYAFACPILDVLSLSRESLRNYYLKIVVFNFRNEYLPHTEEDLLRAF